jgi:hypothetical protein
VAVAFDAVGPSATGTNSGTSPLTWTHTLVSGASTVVLAFVTADSANDSSMSIACTCGGVSMSPVATVHSNSGTVGFGTLFQLTAVTSGAKTITATVTGGSGLDAMSGGSISFTGVNQSTPLGTPVTNTSSGASTPATAALASNTNGNRVRGRRVPVLLRDRPVHIPVHLPVAGRDERGGRLLRRRDIPRHRVERHDGVGDLRR